MSTWPTLISSATPGGIGMASDFDNHRDALNVLGGSWSTYTPTWNAATTAPTIGASSVTGRYRLVGKTVDIHISITIGSGFSAGSGGYTFTLPSGCSILNNGASEAIGFGTARDVSVPASTAFAVYYFSGTSVAMFAADGGAIAAATSPYVWASGDRITLHIPALEIV